MRDVIPDEYVPYPSPSHAYHIKNKGLMSPQTVGGMFAGLKEPEDSDDPAQKVYSKAKFMGTHCQGQT
ncbi:hypothetical protein PAJ97_08955, partial [Campylobacter jejuni]|nr:hypothetical protein [Campylobacter jejuni]